MPFVIIRDIIFKKWIWQLVVISLITFTPSCSSSIQNKSSGVELSCDSLEEHLKKYAARNDTRVIDFLSYHDKNWGTLYSLDSISLPCNITLYTYDLSGFYFSVIMWKEKNLCEVLDTDDLYILQEYGEVWGDVGDIKLLKSKINKCEHISSEEIRVIIENMYNLSHAKLENGNYVSALEYLASSIKNTLPSSILLSSQEIYQKIDSIFIAKNMAPNQNYDKYYYSPDYTVFVCLQIPYENPMEFSLLYIDLVKLFQNN